MGWIDNIRNLTRTKPPETGEKGHEPVTGVKGGGNNDPAKRLLTKTPRDKATLEQYRAIYENGGVVSQAIDAYALNVLKNGWRLEGEDQEGAEPKEGEDKKPTMLEEVEKKLDEIGFDDLIWDAVVDALVFGDAIQEVQLTRGATANIDDMTGYSGPVVYDVLPRAPECFVVRYDDWGVIQAFEFYKDRKVESQKPSATLKPMQAIHVMLLTNTGKVMGDSLVGRAIHDIQRDTVVMEGCTNAIRRHGFPKYHVKVGRVSPVDDATAKAEINEVSKEFVSMDSKTEWVTHQYLDIDSIDVGTITGLESYNKVALERLAAALGVPLEILGLRVGTTDATAVSRQDGFYERIQTFQRRIARVYNEQLIDRITGQPGKVWLVFNPANQPNERDIVSMFKDIASMDPMNGDLYVRECYSRNEWDTTALDEAKEEAEVEVPVQDPMLDPAFQAQQEKMKQPAKVADGEDDKD